MGSHSEVVTLKIIGGIFIGLLIAASISFQLWQLRGFINAGPRFTSGDGQELCERIMVLERINGIKNSCHYARREPIW